MADKPKTPPYDFGLTGAEIKHVKSPYDPTFAPGEATTDDVNSSLLDVIMALAMMGGKGPLTPKEPRLGKEPGAQRMRMNNERSPYTDRYPSRLDLRVQLKDSPEMEALRRELGMSNPPHYDQISGLNRGHAAWRAGQNWEGADILPLPQLLVKGKAPR